MVGDCMTILLDEYTALAEWSQSVPEVVGTANQIAYYCTEHPQSEDVPKPRCKEVGYLPLEWLSHWKKVLEKRFLRIPAEDFRREWMQAVDRCIQKKNPTPVGAGNGIQK